MKNYYYEFNGEQTGPVSLETLKNAGITADTLIWCEGMTQWQPASQVAEVAACIAPSLSSIPPQMKAPAPSNITQRNINAIRPDTHLVWAILTTLFCCMPFGIVAIVHASQVNGLYDAGNYAGALRASNSAKKWSLIAMISLVAVVIIYYLIVVALGVAASSAISSIASDSYSSYY